MASRPIVAVTMGDPAGVGPEVILKALADPLIKRVSRPLVLGDWGVLQRARSRRFRSAQLICWQPGQELLPLLEHPSAHVVCSLSSLTVGQSRPGVASKAAGHAAFCYIRVAANLALSKLADAIATAPISKSSLIDAGYNYPGHTELLADISRTPECRMMLVGAKLRVVPVTGHVRFTKVARMLTPGNIETTLELTHNGLKNFFGIARPRIAVAALNPHGGEKGIFGNEESKVIEPAVRRATIEALSDLGMRSAEAKVAARLADEDEEVREEAASALGEIGSAASAAALEKALGDPNPRVRSEVLSALSELGGPAATRAASFDEAIPQRATRAACSATWSNESPSARSRSAPAKRRSVPVRSR